MILVGNMPLIFQLLTIKVKESMTSLDEEGGNESVDSLQVARGSKFQT
jgi:hypothetical protein